MQEFIDQYGAWGIVAYLIVLFKGELKDLVVYLAKLIKATIDKQFETKDEIQVNSILLQEGMLIQQTVKKLREIFNAQNVSISFYHNGTYDYRNVGFESYSIRYEESRSSEYSIINDYQSKPLSPYYPLIERFKKEAIMHIYVGTEEEQLADFRDYNKLHRLKSTIFCALTYKRRLIGAMSINLDEHSILPEGYKISLQNKLSKIEQIFDDNPSLTKALRR